VFILFWRSASGKKAARKMLVKLTGYPVKQIIKSNKNATQSSKK